MAKLADLIAKIFPSDTEVVVVDEAGQRTISLDTELPEVDGLTLFNEEIPSTGEVVVEQTNPEENFMMYASAEELSQLSARLSAIEGLVKAVDNPGNPGKENDREVW